MSHSKMLMDIYNRLIDRFGEQNWWPAESRFEMMVGAILTQNVNWNNVEIAIVNMKDENILNPTSITDSSLEKIQETIKPTGFYKQKSKRLKRLAKAVMESGGVERLLHRGDLRKYLLNIKGIGPETADSIILYGADEARFIIDAYTMRVLKRVMKYEGTYKELQHFLESNLKKDEELYKEYHALIVELGKNYCKKEPLCSSCPLIEMCQYTEK